MPQVPPILKTFDVVALNEHSADVLDACDRDGVVRIQRQDGRTYTVQREPVAVVANAGKAPWIQLMAEHRAKIAKIFPETLGKEQIREVDRLIAGE